MEKIFNHYKMLNFYCFKTGSGDEDKLTKNCLVKKTQDLEMMVVS